MINTNPQKIDEILTRGVEEIFNKESLLKKLQSGEQMRIKFGIDPTGPKIHIGRAFQFWKLKSFPFRKELEPFRPRFVKLTKTL
jgi:tyrosyl-tRNA synthetase